MTILIGLRNIFYNYTNNYSVKFRIRKIKKSNYGKSCNISANVESLFKYFKIFRRDYFKASLTLPAIPLKRLFHHFSN